MIVMGIDPGSHTTGYGLIQKTGGQILHVDNGCLTTKKSDPISVRLKRIYDSLLEILDRYQPEAVVIEEIFFAKNVSSAMRLGESRGIALLSASARNLPVFEYATRAVKQALTGYGNATKEQMQFMTQKLLKLPEVAQEDASDALALAICHLNSMKIKGLK